MDTPVVARWFEPVDLAAVHWRSRFDVTKSGGWLARKQSDFGPIPASTSFHTRRAESQLNARRLLPALDHFAGARPPLRAEPALERPEYFTSLRLGMIAGSLLSGPRGYMLVRLAHGRSNTPAAQRVVRTIKRRTTW